MNKKLIVYPYTNEFEHLVDYSGIMVGYDLSRLVVTKSYLMQNKNHDLRISDLLSTDFDKEIHACDAILFTGNPSVEEKVLRLAKMHGKELFHSQNVMITSVKSYSDRQSTSRIEVPTIAVMGQGENTQKFNLQLMLREGFVRQGYKVLQFGTKFYSTIFGMCRIPDCGEASLWRKILFLNEYIKHYIHEEKPDIVVVGIPGGLMPLNTLIHQRFGEDAIAICEAVKPDISIVSYYENLAINEVIEMTSDFALKRLGITIDYVHISNTRLVIQSENSRPDYLKIGIEQVRNKCSEITRVYRPFSSGDCIGKSVVINEIINELQNNIEVL